VRSHASEILTLQSRHAHLDVTRCPTLHYLRWLLDDWNERQRLCLNGILRRSDIRAPREDMASIDRGCSGECR